MSTRMGRNACEAVESRFSEATIIDRCEQMLLDLYRPDCLDGTPSTGINAGQRFAPRGFQIDTRKRP